MSRDGWRNISITLIEPDSGGLTYNNGLLNVRNLPARLPRLGGLSANIPRENRDATAKRKENRSMTINKLMGGLGDTIAWNAVNALIEDARANFKGEQQEAFAWAIYNAVRHSDQSQLDNLRALLHKRGIDVKSGEKPTGGWIH